MRLKLTFDHQQLSLPFHYQYALQGILYNLLAGPQSKYGKEFHDVGYQDSQSAKAYKMFVFSNLRGKYRTEGKSLIFEGPVHWYIASEDSDFLKELYSSLSSKKEIELYHQTLQLSKIVIEDLLWFPGKKEFVLELLSPVTAYVSKNKKFEYYEPGSDRFEELCRENLRAKCRALGIPQEQIEFSVQRVERMSKRVVHFKNTFYIAYSAVLTVQVNYQTMRLIWNTGLSAKGSSGFGMIGVIYERDLPL